MVGPGTRLINGGGSHLVAEEEERSRWINDSPNLPVLDPFGLWFHCDKVKKAAREAVLGNFDKFTPSYYAATSEQKEAWWNRFKTHFKYQNFREPDIKAGFAEYCNERLRDLVCRAGTRKNTWMGADAFEEMLAYRATEAFKNRSAKSKKNRRSKGKNGKAPGTHTMGRLNSIQYMDKLSTIKAKKDALLEAHTEEEIDDNEIYIESVNGFNKKGEVWGMGKATSIYYDKPLPSKARRSATSYTPGFVSKLSAENQAMKDELKDMKQWKLMVEQTLASQGIHIPTQSCNPNSQVHDRHDNDGNGGNGSDFATQILAC